MLYVPCRIFASNRAALNVILRRPGGQLEQEYTLQARNVVLQMVKVLNNQIKALQCQFATVFENHTRRLQTATGKLGRILTEETSMKINMPRMKSETATHDIMMQMKSHLEKLKNVLESKSKTSGKVTSSELGIMNELIEKHKKWEQENHISLNCSQLSKCSHVKIAHNSVKCSRL